MGFIDQLKSALERSKNEGNARQMEAYMKDLFPFLGIKAPERKTLLKNVLNSEKEEVSKNYRTISKQLYGLNEREYQYCAIEIIGKFLNKDYQEHDIEIISYLITMKPHWDTVDFIAKHILGNYILQFWESRHKHIDAFSSSEDMWLNRSALLFQLGYKTKTDKDILFSQCEKHSASDEFFIQKAIGWALREYAKTNPQSVVDFVSNAQLKPLSKREALKRLK